MIALAFEDHRQMSDWIRAHGPLPIDREVRVGARTILPGRRGGGEETRSPGGIC